MNKIKKWLSKIGLGLKADAESREYRRSGRYLGYDNEYPNTYRPELKVKPKVKTIAVTALIAATAATANAGDKHDKSSGVTTGLTNPYGNSSVSRPTWPFGWLTRGWDFGWGFWRDGLDSWQSGHPVITIDPEPPSNSDTSGK